MKQVNLKTEPLSPTTVVESGWHGTWYIQLCLLVLFGFLLC